MQRRFILLFLPLLLISSPDIDSKSLEGCRESNSRTQQMMLGADAEVWLVPPIGADTIDFGTISVGEVGERIVLVVNRSRDPILLSWLSLPRSSTNFLFAEGPIPVLPRMLLPGDTLGLPLTFSGHMPGRVIGRLDARIGNDSTFSATLIGTISAISSVEEDYQPKSSIPDLNQR